MTPALLLVDLQEDYLASPGLVPHRGEVVAGAARLLARCRAYGVPVFHAWTTVRREDDQRMPHWKSAARWRCVDGSPGHAPPAELRPAPDEEIVHKTHFSAFGDGALAERLRARGVDTVWLAGVHAHACVRASAIDAYRLGFAVAIASDAVASDQPLHADTSRRWLAARFARFAPGATLVREASPARATAHASCDAPVLPALVLGRDTVVAGDAETALAHETPAQRGRTLWRVPIATAAQVEVAAQHARDAQPGWAATDPADRLAIIARLADAVEAARASLARRMAVEIGKPLFDARLEVDFALALIRAASRRAAELLGLHEPAPSPFGRERRRPLGTVALITPWNVPLAIPLGKIVPALLYGNAVVWKPAPAGSGVALDVFRLLGDAGVPRGAVTLVCGDHASAESLLESPLIDAVSLTGSSAVGTCAQAICAARRVPLQAELGGNNAAIVWSDADLDDAAVKLAAGAFGSAGQRCTANRRVIVDARCADALLARLRTATDALAWGDPLDEATRVGPLVSAAACARVAAVVERARVAGAEPWTAPSHAARAATLGSSGAFHPPQIVRCDDPSAEIVQEETFGPVAVVQVATSWDEALHLLNGVPQGLVAALFSKSTERRESFLEQARAGILKIGSATAGVGAETPFAGWKASGVGPAEHGAGDPEFYTRAQAVYVDDTPSGQG